jgi:hypothetical protein
MSEPTPKKSSFTPPVWFWPVVAGIFGLFSGGAGVGTVAVSDRASVEVRLDDLEDDVEALDSFREQSGLMHAAHVKDIESLEQDQQWLLTAMWAICQHLEAECPTRGR